MNMIAASFRSFWDKVSFRSSMESHDEAGMGWDEECKVVCPGRDFFM